MFGPDANCTGKLRLVVFEEHAKRAHDGTLANIEQYKRLVYMADEDDINWSLNKSSRVKSKSNSAVKKSIVGKYDKPNVYVKVVPKEGEILEFVHHLCKLNNDRLTYDNYITKCKKISLLAK